MKHWPVCFAIVLTAPTAFAQASAGQSLQSAFKYFKDIHLFPNPPVEGKNQYPVSGSSSQAAPPALGPIDYLAGEKDFRLQIVKGGRIAQANGDNLKVTGEVEALYRGYTMTCDTLTANLKQQVFVLRDNAALVGPGATVRAQEIIVDYKNQTYQAFASRADMKPMLVGGNILDDVYMNAKESSGGKNESYVTIGDLTTCNKEHPDYDIHARQIDIRYGKRIILRGVSVDVLGKRLFSLPFLSLPLDDRTYQNLPYAGQDPTEGYFVKTHYSIPLAGPNTLVTREDYMTRLGLGLGAAFLYQRLKGGNPYAGDIGFYGVTGARTLNLNFDNALAIGGGKLQVNATYQGNDYLTAPDSKVYSGRMNYDLRNRYGSSSLNFNFGKNSSAGFDSTTQNWGLSNSESLGSNLRFDTQLSYADSASSYNSGGSTTQVENRSLNVRFNATDDLKQATATLGYQRTIPIGSIQNFYVGSQQTPVFTLSSTSRQLFGKDFGSEVPFNVQASIGEFGDPISKATITRDFFSFSGNKSFSDSNSVNTFSVQSQFRQGIYSDNTAQYTLGFGTNYTHRLGKDTAFNLTYNYLRPEGYSPLGIDSSGKMNLASANLTVRPLRDLLLGLQTGYDAIQLEQQNTPWQVVSLRAEYGIKKYFLARTLATYDPFVGSWANVRFDLAYQPGDTYVGLGLRYDAIRHTWGDVNGFIQALKWGKAKIDLLADFNGYSGRIQSEQLNMTYDLHCAEAVLQVVNNQVGFRNGLQLVFFIRLKALPFGSIFGAGTRGQPIGLGTGLGY